VLEFLLTDPLQMVQPTLGGVPDQGFIDGLVLVSIHIPGGGDDYPIDLGVAVAEVNGEPPAMLPK
jgi:hypothetical protein